MRALTSYLRSRDFILDLFWDVAGSILYGLGIYTFALSAEFAPAGVSGIAIIINHLTHLPIGVLILLINIPIILVSYHIMGRRFLLVSLKSMCISTFFIDVVFPRFPIYNGSPILAALFTGVLSGAGLVAIYMRGSSTGGTDFLILSIRKKIPHLTVGQISIACDTMVYLFAMVVFRNINAVLYGLIATYAATQVMDSVMYSAGSGKMALIITNKGDEVARQISNETGRGSTLFLGKGTYSGEEREMLLCACSKNEIIRVRNCAHKVDPGAMVMIAEANEVFGEGFKAPEVTG